MLKSAKMWKIFENAEIFGNLVNVEDAEKLLLTNLVC